MDIYISRENILEDSIDQFESKDIGNKKLEITYINEEGADCGGLLRDWFTTVSNEIVESGTFKPVPNGTYLIIDERYADEKILKFTGQLIASAYNNKSNVNIKFASFIWKIFLHEKITIDDMKEYDELVYQSLKWILNNDVSDLEELFVDRNDKELKPNGKNIKLTNENKREYISLVLKRTFIGKNEKLYNLLLAGFNTTINKDELHNYNAKEFRDKIIGQETIDLIDWKENTQLYDDDDDIIDTFFDILSNWTDEKLRKLLKFVTGSSSVPINGFEYLENLGGKFTIDINYNSNDFPEAHTCFNRLVLPCDNDEDELERKLLIAIETVDFGLE